MHLMYDNNQADGTKRMRGRFVRHVRSLVPSLNIGEVCQC